MKISIAEIKQLLNNGKTDNKKYKFKDRTQLVHLNSFSTSCDYFDVLFMNNKKEVFMCCVHQSDLESEDSKEINIIKLS